MYRFLHTYIQTVQIPQCPSRHVGNCFIIYSWQENYSSTCDNNTSDLTWFDCQFLLSHAYYKQHKAYILRLDKYFFHRTAFDMNFLRRIISSARFILLPTLKQSNKLQMISCKNFDLKCNQAFFGGNFIFSYLYRPILNHQKPA